MKKNQVSCFFEAQCTCVHAVRKPECPHETKADSFRTSGLVTKLWSIGLVTCRLRFESHQGSFASNLEHAANLLCYHVNSTSYPQWGGKWVITTGCGMKA